MSRKLKISIIVILLSFIFVGCAKKTDTITNNTNKNQGINETNSTVENYEEKEVNVTLSSDEFKLNDNSKEKKLMDKLQTLGEKIYKDKQYEKYEKKNDIYFISLNDLHKDFNLDISDFKGSDGTTCDRANSGIFFDVDNKMNIKFKENAQPVIPLLIGCNKSELPENNKKVEENKTLDN